MTLLIGKKLGMTHLFDESGKATPVTVIEAGPCPIVQVKTEAKEGYAAIQIGYITKKASRSKMPEIGHFAKSGNKPLRVVREMRVDDTAPYKVGEALDVKMFEGVTQVHVTGTSKGRGFTGTIKKHNFQRGRKTHGNKNYRQPGSTGMAATPKRVYKGRKMAGRHGGTCSTTRNLTVVRIDAENNLLFVKGAVPGATNGIVFIRS